MRLITCFFLSFVCIGLNAQNIILHKRITSSYDDHYPSFSFRENNAGMVGLWAYRSEVLFYGQSPVSYVFDPLDKPSSAFGKLLLVDSVLELENSQQFLARIDVDPISTGENHFTLSGKFYDPLEPIRVGGRELFIDSLVKAEALAGSNQHYITRFNSAFEIQSILTLDARTTSELELEYSNGEYVFALSADQIAKIENSYYIASEMNPLAESFTIVGKLDSVLKVKWTDTLFHCGLHSVTNQPIKWAVSPEKIKLLKNSDIVMLVNIGGGSIQYNEDTVLTGPDKSWLSTYLLHIDSNGVFKKSFAFENNPILGDGLLGSGNGVVFNHIPLVTNGATIVHFVDYDEAFSHKGINYPAGHYFVFFDDTLGVKRIMNNPYALGICSGSDGSFYWAGSMSKNQSYDFGSIHIDADPTNRLIVGKISADAEYLWVETYNGQLAPYSITEQNRRLAVIGQLKSDFFDSNGDTLIKYAPSRHRTSGLLIIEDQHFVGKHEVLEEGAFLNVFPNPTKGNFTIRWRFKQGVNIRISDISGRIIQEYQAREASGEISFKTDKKGIYFIELEDGILSKTKKIIVL